ncbi:MAG: NAD(P)-binding protein [Desulfobacterales bacterium]|nr:NAD(P)-binding protein [Desulfobacterales bacterium]MDD4071896.1 NAD(P)-binding protein [Desulfobacterales bacterium]MDD4392505.1 NAD(P)-binding protein [Desulfobacterales bacterium]
MSGPLKVKSCGAVLIVGAGIAGLLAAEELAASGYDVWLIEESSAAGGRMAQLDRLFPADDCAM